jgi:hypothetical protein
MCFSSTTIEQLVHYCKQLPRAALVFFYFDFDDTKKRDFDALIRSLLTQLLFQCETIPKVLLDLYQSHMNSYHGFDNDVLVEAFRELVRTFQDVYIVLDALDESSECVEALRFIENVQDWSLSQVHVLVTSRQFAIIEISFENLVFDRICLQESPMNRDILIYIEDKLVNDKFVAKWPLDVREQARTKLLAGEEGTQVSQILLSAMIDKFQGFSGWYVSWICYGDVCPWLLFKKHSQPLYRRVWTRNTNK